MAAVNNLMTNCNVSEMDAEAMIAISNRLGEAEVAIRDGESSVEEVGGTACVQELYATASGGHFDVQTLQIAFDDAGFQMSYVTKPQLQRFVAVFPSNDELAGYVVHRRDPLNPQKDHWFVLRRHAGEVKKSKKRFLLQDSLYDKVFELTDVEAHQLLLSCPAGALF